MNTGYTIYQFERTKSAAEQREVDRSNAQLAAAISRLRACWLLASPRKRPAHLRRTFPRERLVTQTQFGRGTGDFARYDQGRRVRPSMARRPGGPGFDGVRPQAFTYDVLPGAAVAAGRAGPGGGAGAGNTRTRNTRGREYLGAGNTRAGDAGPDGAAAT